MSSILKPSRANAIFFYNILRSVLKIPLLLRFAYQFLQIEGFAFGRLPLQSDGTDRADVLANATAHTLCRVNHSHLITLGNRIERTAVIATAAPITVIAYMRKITRGGDDRD